MDLADYRIEGADRILTPALVVYPQFVDSNIEATLRLLGGDGNRWRPHLKTNKMPYAIRRLMDHGVKQFKCSTTRELVVAIEAGARDVLLAYPLVGANARRVVEIAEQHPAARISVLIENARQAAQWDGSNIGIFVDVNPGMDRTGIQTERADEIARLAKSAGAHFRGLHYYDGHVAEADRAERERHAHAGYDRLMELVEVLTKAGSPPPEIITSGTPAFPYAAGYRPFRSAEFVQRVSPGTVVFCDLSSEAQLPEEYGFRPAALVLATVVSRPTPDRITCNAGHKSVSADAGVPTCSVVGWPGLNPQKPSEEHLPIDIATGGIPEIGESLYLLPRHICPTVNNFDEAVMVRGGVIEGTERILARGHEMVLG